MHIGWLNTDGCSNCSDACVCLLCHGNHSAIGGGRNSRNLTISCHTRQERSDPNPQRLSRVHDLLQCFGLIWTESSDAGFALPLYLLRICKSNKWGSNRPSMTNKMHKHFQLEREALSTRTFDEPKFAYKGRYDWYWLIMIDRNIMEYSLVPSSVCVPFHGHILPTLCQVFIAFLFCHRGGCQIMIQAMRRPWQQGNKKQRNLPTDVDAFAKYHIESQQEWHQLLCCRVAPRNSASIVRPCPVRMWSQHLMSGEPFLRHEVVCHVKMHSSVVATSCSFIRAMSVFCDIICFFHVLHIMYVYIIQTVMNHVWYTQIYLHPQISKDKS